MTAPKRPRVVWLVVMHANVGGHWFTTRKEAVAYVMQHYGRVVRAEVKP